MLQRPATKDYGASRMMQEQAQTALGGLYSSADSLITCMPSFSELFICLHEVAPGHDGAVYYFYMSRPV